MSKVKKAKHTVSDRRFEVILVLILCIIGIAIAYPLVYVLSSSFCGNVGKGVAAAR